MPQCCEHQLQGVYVARTTATSQPEFSYFLHRFSKSLGIIATVKDIASTHMTLLESCGVKSQFYDRNYTEVEVRQFCNRIQRRIDKSGHNKYPMEVKVDPEEPLRWVGRVDLDCQPIRDSNGNELLPYKFAMGLLLDERLKDQRGIVEEVVEEEFGEMPKIRELSPHVTIGEIGFFWQDQYCGKPAIDLLPSKLAHPESIVMNGLAAYLGFIHGPRETIAA